MVKARIKDQPGDPGGPQDPPDPPGFPDEQAALKSVKVHSFQAKPHVVPPFEKTTVSWNVTVPTDAPAEVTIKLDGKVVFGNSSQDFVVTTNHEYVLLAATEHKGRILGKANVAMDAAECQLEIVQAAAIIAAVQAQIRTNFLEDSQVKLRDPVHVAEVTLDIGMLSVHVPLEIEVPDWFNADMDIYAQLEVIGGTSVPMSRPVMVRAKDLRIDVSWTFFENLLSLGCGDLVESGMEHMAQPLLFHILAFEIAPELQRQLTIQLNQFLTTLQNADPQRRKFGPAVVWFNSNGLNMTACPLPPSVTPGPVVNPIKKKASPARKK